MMNKFKKLLYNSLFLTPIILLFLAAVFSVFADTLDPTENYAPDNAGKRAVTYVIERHYASSSDLSSVRSATQTTPLYVGGYRTAIIQVYGGLIYSASVSSSSPALSLTGAMNTSAVGTGAYGSYSSPSWWIEGKPGFSATSTRYATMPIKLYGASSYVTSASAAYTAYNSAIHGTTDALSIWGMFEVDLRGVGYMRFNMVNNASDHVVVIGLDEN